MSVHRADGSGLRDEALQPSIRGASCIGRARARRLDGLSFFGPVQRPGPRNSASAETTCGQSTPTKVQPYPIAYRCLPVVSLHDEIGDRRPGWMTDQESKRGGRGRPELFALSL